MVGHGAHAPFRQGTDIWQGLHLPLPKEQDARKIETAIRPTKCELN